MKNTLQALAFLFAVAATPLAADDYPAPALKPLIVKKTKGGWKLPEGTMIIGMDAGVILEAIGKKAVFVETEYIRLVSTVPPVKVRGLRFQVPADPGEKEARSVQSVP